MLIESISQANNLEGLSDDERSGSSPGFCQQQNQVTQLLKNSQN